MKLASKIFRRTDWYVTSPFGWRTLNGTTAMHQGTDYGTNNQKLPQHALENGTVVQVNNDEKKYTAGKFVIINYPRIGKQVHHYHLDSVAVSQGQPLQEGTLIGYTGTTGNSTGIHLHLGMRNIGDSTYLDPHAYDYQEESLPIPTPQPEPEITFPFKAVIKKGSPLYKIDGKQYPNGTIADREVTVLGEVGSRYKVEGKMFVPNIVYCNKTDMK